MSSTAASSTNLEAKIAAAFEEYKKKTKIDIASHPLATELRSCQSTGAILAILRAQVQTFDKSQSPDEKLTKWLDPTINVLYAFSVIVGDAVGLVIPTIKALRHLLSNFGTGISAFECDLCWDWYPLPSEQLP